MRGFTMKKIHVLFSLLLITGTAQLSAMKRSQSQMTDTTPESQITTTTSETQQELWLLGDIIMKIAAMCDAETRTNWSLISKLYNRLASIKNNPTIVDQPEFGINEKHRLYYLFYGCIHNLKNVVQHALGHFDPEKKEVRQYSHHNEEYYPDKITLNEAKYHIEQFTNSESVKLLPYYPDIKINSDETIFDCAGNNNDVQLFNFCIKNANFNNLNAMPRCITESVYLDPDSFHGNDDDNFTKEEFAMLKTLLIHNRYSANQLCYCYGKNIKLQLWSTPSLTAAKLFLDYDKVNNINRCNSDYNGMALLHIYVKLPNTVKLLLTHAKINVNIKDKKGDTPLHTAIDDSNLKTIKLLLAHPDVNVNLQNNDRYTPLHSAIVNACNDTEEIEIVKLLLAHPDINVNLQNNDGDTALHITTKSEDWEIVKLLLTNQKINVSIPNKEGISPIQYMRTKEQLLLTSLEKKISDSKRDRIEQEIIKINALQTLFDDAQILFDDAQVNSYFA